MGFGSQLTGKGGQRRINRRNSRGGRPPLQGKEGRGALTPSLALRPTGGRRKMEETFLALQPGYFFDVLGRRDSSGGSVPLWHRGFANFEENFLTLQACYFFDVLRSRKSSKKLGAL